MSLPSNARAASTRWVQSNPVAVSGRGIRPGSAHLDLSDKDPSENQNSSRQKKTQSVSQMAVWVLAGPSEGPGGSGPRRETDIPPLSVQEPQLQGSLRGYQQAGARARSGLRFPRTRKAEVSSSWAGSSGGYYLGLTTLRITSCSPLDDFPMGRVLQASAVKHWYNLSCTFCHVEKW